MANIPDVPLPTFDRLGITALDLPPHTSISPASIAADWLAAFATAASASPADVDALAALLLPGPDAFWRDMLALTWDFRTFSGQPKIRAFLTARLANAKMHDFKLREGSVVLQQPFPDLAWISLMFDFSTDVGRASGVVRLVPTASGHANADANAKVDLTSYKNWKAHVVYTNLDSLTAFPEKTGALRNAQPNHGKWESAREREREFLDADGNADTATAPKVLVIGGGQSGLEVAARLKFLDIPALVVERNERIGDNWRGRYEALCLHDPVWYDHMPYLPFPSTWPVYTPALKLANWLESYASTLELNVWTSTTITHTTQDPTTNKWHVGLKRADGSERTFVVNHVVFCTGLGSGVPNTPAYPGMDLFKGKILHSSEHKRALDHEGKKVVVVGACTSAHDIAVDYQQHGIDVTMFQRSSTYIMSTKNGWEVIMKGAYWEDAPPVDVVDRINASFPHHMATGLKQRETKYIAELDKDLLDGLHKVGFRTNLGIKDTGFGLLAWSKAGGYYLDTGGSKLIAEGKIKLKNDSPIESFTETGIKFANGTELPADVVVFATGLGDPVGHIRRVCGDEVANRCKDIWGLNDEGELNGVWRDLGVPGLWMMLGNLALCRFHSTHIALQIKAMEEGVFGTRYEA
ncbi:hypothetical protein GALMADRAFT_259418 [Galerina marginata CBS 339.88]|uniref:FAD/NAD(P)-binding domain-containing protein n=1 Tax=Galerina marginata (strain CBS 339.88) TaxID=685588 RepID=A0A067SF31_GALM3|nr:hypothetical protein GALMADRAFT_259418 [Galerina marginata CBS 339.88]